MPGAPLAARLALAPIPPPLQASRQPAGVRRSSLARSQSFPGTGPSDFTFTLPVPAPSPFPANERTDAAARGYSSRRQPAS